MIALWVALGAAVGAPLRYLTDRAVQSRATGSRGGGFPWGTLTVNVVGSFVLGVVVAAAGVLGPAVQAVLGTGFCGALTTYSTFGYETYALSERGELRTSVTYVLVSVVAGLASATAGYVIGSLPY